MADIELRNLTKRFGDLVAVDSVDLDVEAGEVMCLLGPSGCGKTTTLRMIGGLEWATEGDIFISGKRVNDLKPAQRDIAMVFQFYALYPSLTVAENLAFPLHAEKIGEEEIEKRVTRIANILELSHAMGRIPGRLSEGEKQRVDGLFQASRQGLWRPDRLAISLPDRRIDKVGHRRITAPRSKRSQECDHAEQRLAEAVFSRVIRGEASPVAIGPEVTGELA